MKMRKIMCGILIFLAGGGLFFCVLGGCGERWLPNQSGTRAFRFTGRQEGLVGLLVKSMKKGMSLGLLILVPRNIIVIRQGGLPTIAFCLEVLTLAIGLLL